MRRIDIALLPLLGSAGQQDDDRLAIPSEINPITRTKIDPIFQRTFSHAFYIGEIALLDASARTILALAAGSSSAKGPSPLAAT
jgi:hypothetical protein